MNHQERWAACRTVSDRLRKKYAHDVIATAVTGSVGRGDDGEFSDIDFSVLVRRKDRLHSHRFVLKGCLFSVAASTERDWLEELTRPNYALPLVIGSLKSTRAIQDPEGSFRRLRRTSEDLSRECWNNAVRAGLEEIVEDLGRVRNAYALRDWKSFRLHSPHVALEAALVQCSLRKRAVLTEKNLLEAQLQGYSPQFIHALLTGAGIKMADNRQVLKCLEWMYSSLSEEASRQGSAPTAYDSITSYHPP
jgi:predicted nucleotidyltransferase